MVRLSSCNQSIELMHHSPKVSLTRISGNLALFTTDVNFAPGAYACVTLATFQRLCTSWCASSGPHYSFFTGLLNVSRRTYFNPVRSQ